MSYKEHSQLYSPEENCKIAKYLDLEKLISMLHRKALFFTRVDKMQDHFEGTFTQPDIEARRNWYRKHKKDNGEFYSEEEIEAAIKKYDETAYKKRSMVIISCWHESGHESAAMWKIFSDMKEGIMLTSTFENFRKCFDSSTETVYISKVNYLNYESDKMPEENPLFPFVHKQKFYDYEKEIRGLIEIEHQGGDFDWSQEEIEEGRYISVNLDELIEEVIVAPFAPDWFVEIVEVLLSKFDLNKKVRRSSLSKF